MVVKPCNVPRGNEWYVIWAPTRTAMLTSSGVSVPFQVEVKLRQQLAAAPGSEPVAASMLAELRALRQVGHIRPARFLTRLVQHASDACDQRRLSAACCMHTIRMHETRLPCSRIRPCKMYVRKASSRSTTAHLPSRFADGGPAAAPAGCAGRQRGRRRQHADRAAGPDGQRGAGATGGARAIATCHCVSLPLLRALKHSKRTAQRMPHCGLLHLS